MPSFVVECYWPGITEEQVRHALALVGRARNGSGAGEPVSRLGCILVPSDGMAVFLFRPFGAPALGDRPTGRPPVRRDRRVDPCQLPRDR